MTSVTRLRVQGAVLALATALGPGVALAQTSAADVSLARQLGNRGLELAASGDCAGAIEKLKRAEALYHAPTTLTVLGECHVSVGKLVDGVEELTRVAREDLGPRSPPAFRKAQARARQKLELARPRLPRIRIAVEGAPASAPMDVRIDGDAVPAATLDLDRPVDPGPHDIEVKASGYKPATAHIVAKEGVSQAIKLTLEASAGPAPVPAPAPAPLEASAGPSPNPAPSEHHLAKPTYVPAFVLLGVGAAGIAVGSILGVATLDKASRLDTACQPRSDCPPSQQGEISSAKTLALGSTIAFGVGAVGAGLGAYFLLAPPSKDTGPSPEVSVRPWIGPGSAGFAGVF
jgi:hypothetical protein